MVQLLEVEFGRFRHIIDPKAEDKADEGAETCCLQCRDLTIPQISTLVDTGVLYKQLSLGGVTDAVLDRMR